MQPCDHCGARFPLLPVRIEIVRESGPIGLPGMPAPGQSANFTGTGTDPNNNLPLTYLWNFGGGATNSTVQNPGVDRKSVV